jgi:sorbitol/mannitol transport system permease protein
MNQTFRFRAVLSWVIALIVFFPIIMMLITSFKTEQQAISVPPSFIFEPTVETTASFKSEAIT